MVQLFGTIYLGVGGIVSFISLGSSVFFYGFGPGAIWEIGFVASIIGMLVAWFFAFLRLVTWPYGLYILVTNPDGFFPWLFYLW